jgi:hypothetical protein
MNALEKYEAADAMVANLLRQLSDAESIRVHALEALRQEREAELDAAQSELDRRRAKQRAELARIGARPSRTDRDVAILRRVMAGQETLSAIAADYGISGQRVSAIAKENGVARPRRGRPPKVS